MSDLPHLLKKAQRTVLSCAIALALTLTALGSLLWYDRKLEKRMATAEQTHVALQAEQNNLADNLKAVTSGQSEFLMQQRQGLVGQAQREQWAQSLIAAFHAQQFSGVPDYTLKAATPFQWSGAGASGSADAALAAVTSAAAPKPLAAPAKGGAAAAAPATPGVPVVVQTHELLFNLVQAHEVDVLAVLSQLQLKHAGVVQLDQCTLTDPKPEGLRASCSLKFFNLSRAETPAATVATAGAAATPR